MRVTIFVTIPAFWAIWTFRSSCFSLVFSLDVTPKRCCHINWKQFLHASSLTRSRQFVRPRVPPPCAPRVLLFFSICQLIISDRYSFHPVSSVFYLFIKFYVLGCSRSTSVPRPRDTMVFNQQLTVLQTAIYIQSILVYFLPLIHASDHYNWLRADSDRTRAKTVYIA